MCPCLLQSDRVPGLDSCYHVVQLLQLLLLITSKVLSRQDVTTERVFNFGIVGGVKIMSEKCFVMFIQLNRVRCLKPFTSSTNERLLLAIVQLEQLTRQVRASG